MTSPENAPYASSVSDWFEIERPSPSFTVMGTFFKSVGTLYATSLSRRKIPRKKTDCPGR